ncbi:MAG: 4-alpha-glucanotransferase [Ruthenibacterium sp.]
MRSCGILMPISSLPAPYGIGSLGKEAYQFVDFLQRAGQHFWQILPIGPTGYGNSPYQSFSAFAANPYFIDLDALVGRGLLTHEEIDAAYFGDNPLAVDYGALHQNRFALLQKAVDRFVPAEDGFANFRAKSVDWLADYALFMALKFENGMVALSQWPEELRTREPQALAAARARLASQIMFWEVLQYLFDEQWVLLKRMPTHTASR